VAIVNIAELYSAFQTGDFPSEQDFKNLIDSSYNYFLPASAYPVNSEIVLPGDLIVSGGLSAVDTFTSLYKILSGNRDLAEIFFLKTLGESVHTSVLQNSGKWDQAYTATSANSAEWDSVYSTTQSNSAGWESVETSVRDASANWNSVYNSVYNSVVPTSASWNSVYNSTRNTSGNWDSVYSSVAGVSSSWNDGGGLE